MRLIVEPMDLEDIPQVLEVDRESYTLPWPASAYRREVLHNRNARYLVLRQLGGLSTRSDDPEPEKRLRLPIPFFRWTDKLGESKPGRPGHVVGYAGMWLMVDEAHVTTIALRNTWRGQGLGELLLASLVDIATDMGAQRVTLEVRVSNATAQNLYHKYGFSEEGRRPRYYSDNNEDAFIMSTNSIQTDEYRLRFEGLVDQLRARLCGADDRMILAPAFPEEVG